MTENNITSHDEAIFNKRIWTVEDVCKVLGLKKGTIYNMTSKDEIPFRKPGGKRLYFIPDEILDWIDEGKR
jgi:excisionase family DNA binding protein